MNQVLEMGSQRAIYSRNPCPFSWAGRFEEREHQVRCQYPKDTPSVSPKSWRGPFQVNNRTI